MATGRVNVGGGGARLNIFTQLTEPKTKEGIWLRTDKAYKKVVSDVTVWLANTFRDDGLVSYIPAAKHQASSVAHSGFVYLIGGYVNSTSLTKCYRYDIQSDTWSEIAPMPIGVFNTRAIAHNNKIYVIGGRLSGGVTDSLQIYDIFTNTWSLGEPIPTTVSLTYPGLYGHIASIFEDKIYVMDGLNSQIRDNKNLGCYDIKTDTWSLVHQGVGAGYYLGGHCGCIIASIFYQFNGTTYRKVNIDTGEVSIGALPFTTADRECIPIGNKIYLCSTTMLWSYDTLTDSFEEVAPLSNNMNGRNEKRLSYYNGMIYFMGSGQSQTFQSALTASFSFLPKRYENGTVIIIRVDNYYGEYKTELITPISFNGQFSRLLSVFDDVFLYVENDMFSVETFVGDGESWVKFKEAI